MSRSPVAFGQYVITRRIARGGMAEIYRAKRRSAGEVGKGQWVALKMMRPSLEHEELREQLFKREAKIAAAIDHPNVIPLFEFGRDLDRYYIAMEYLRGRDLSHLIREDQAKGEFFPLEIGLHVGLKAAAGLGHAHRLTDPSTGENLQIVHRDISPGNVMIGYDGSVKVLDFGVARMSETHGLRTQTGTLRGKFAYMSPEQTIGAAIDARSDVFSLGTLIYELLTGTNPFRARTPIATLERVQRVRPVPPSRANRKIEREVDELLARCLAKDPRRRFKDAAEFHDALAEYLDRRIHIDDQLLPRFMAERFVWEKQEEEKELKEEEEEVALIEVVDFALGGDDKGLDARHVAVSLEEEAEKHAVVTRGTFDGTAAVAEEEEALGVFDVESNAETLAHPSKQVRALPRPASPSVNLREEPSDPLGDIAKALRAPVPESSVPNTDDDPSGATVAQPGFGWGRKAPSKSRELEASSLFAPPTAATKPEVVKGHETDPWIAAMKEGRRISAHQAPAVFSTPIWRRKAPLIGAATGVVALIAAGGIFATLASQPEPLPITVPPANSPTKIAPITIKLDVPREPDEVTTIPPTTLREEAPPAREEPPAREPRREQTAAARLERVERERVERAERAERIERERDKERDTKQPERDAEKGDRRKTKRSGGTGFLNIGAKPWAEIEIDGKTWPYQTPQAGIELSTGRHVIKLHNRETGVTKTQVVTIKAGAYKTITHDMRSQ